MQTITATEFVNNFGKQNIDVQRDVIEVTSHGRPVGYYISANEYAVLKKIKNKNVPYVSIRPQIIAQADKIKKIAKDHNATSISLFGSVARGEDNKNSDIDFLVDFPKNYDLLKDRIGLGQALEDLLGRKIDLVLRSEMNSDLAPSILSWTIKLQGNEL